MTGQRTELFHPVQQRWGEHFRLEEDGTLTGLTPTGRTTTAALGMNARIPQFARACQIALGLLSRR